MLSFSLIGKFRRESAKLGGNMKGEGMIKGAMFVLGPKGNGDGSNQILTAYAEEFGKDIDFKKLEEGMRRLKEIIAAQGQGQGAAAASSSSSAEGAASKL